MIGWRDPELDPANFTAPPQMYRSVSFYVTTDVTIRCGETLLNTKNWVVEEIDSAGDVIQELDINELPSK